MATNIGQRNSLYSLSEEIGNAVTHGIAAMISVLGLAALLIRAGGRPWETAAVAIYGASMLFAFSMSSLYHAITNVRVKMVFRVLDHSSVFLLIAGTYTPFTLVTLRGPIGWTVFGVVWAIAAFGITLNIIGLERFKKVSMFCYIASGWCIIAAAFPLWRALPKSGVTLLFLGGILYTSGLLFYGKKRIPYMHMTWHFFVLAGAAAHYFSIMYYVI